MPNIIRIKRGDAEILDKFYPLADGELAVTRYKEITGGPQRGEKVLDQTLRVGVFNNIKDYSVIGSESIFYEIGYLMHLVSMLTSYCKDLEDNIRNNFLIQLQKLINEISTVETQVSSFMGGLELMNEKISEEINDIKTVIVFLAKIILGNSIPSEITWDSLVDSAKPQT